MKASELRIWNIIYCQGTMTYVYQLDSGGVTACQINDIKVNKETGATLGTGNIDFTPIPLTEEWLVKFGFSPVISTNKMTDAEISNGKLCFEFYKGKLFFTAGEGLNLSRQIDYVHDFQNICYALTGEELTCIQ